MSTSHIPVIIVGGGIVGLSASLFLTYQGIQSLLIERHSGTSIHPRARSVNARTMEMYRSLGLCDSIREAGASLAPSMGIHSGSSLTSVISTKPRKEGKRLIPFSGLFREAGPESGAFVTQDMIEPVLLDAARERGGDVRFSTECLSVEQDVHGVTVTLRDRDSGSTSIFTADYLIAADGAGSPIREQLGVETTGRGSMGNLLNILFHADLKDLVQQREFSLCVIENPEVNGLFTAINNKDRWVFHLSYDPAKGEKAEDFLPERCVELLRIALGIPDIEIDIKSILPWQPSVQIAEKLQIDRIFLAGDAAHQMPPWAGQGANSGISDAQNLAWKLALVLKQQAGTALLESYEAERLPVGRAAAEASASAAGERGIFSTKRNFSTVMGLLRRLHLLSGFGYIYTSKAVLVEDVFPLGGLTWKPWSMVGFFLSLDGRPGSRAPHVWVQYQGKRISTLDLFGKGFVLLAGSQGSGWCNILGNVIGGLRGVQLAAFTVGPKGDIVDNGRGWQIAAGISSTGAVLVRPDGFVAWRERRQPLDLENRAEEVIRQVLCL